MVKNWIKNIDNLADTPQKKIMFELVNAMFNSIDTEKVIENHVAVNQNILSINGQTFDLSRYNRIRVIAFGKASCEAAGTLEKILDNRIHEGIIIDIKETKCKIIESFVGTHPRPSMANVTATKNILEFAKDTNDKDLVLVAVSGGGSALLCSSEDECNQGQKLYDDFLRSGGTIKELNIVRKHISTLKGGGLAKLFYPATIIGLIFCDISGGHYDQVASGPTFKDITTIDDARKIIDKYKLEGFSLIETPKEDIYFEKVINISMISNVIALEAISQKAKELGMSAKIISSEIFEDAKTTINNFLEASEETDVIIGGGEITVSVKGNKGSGGRCLYLAMSILPYLKENQVFAAIASDGMDNCDSAGAVVDINSYKKSQELGLDLKKHIDDADAYSFFEKTGELIMTGPTGANVADAMILLNKK